MRRRRRPGGCASDERGQATVELTLLLPVLLLMVVGVINFAFIFHTYILVVNAAGVGATYAASNAVAATDLDGIRKAALADSDHWHCNQPTVTATAPVGDPYGYQRISVTVTCPVSDLIIGPSGLGPVTVSATATRRVRK